MELVVVGFIFSEVRLRDFKKQTDGCTKKLETRDVLALIDEPGRGGAGQGGAGRGRLHVSGKL